MFDFLKKLLANLLDNTTYLRPPGAFVDEAEFVQKCIKCNKCAQVCPYDSIIMLHADAGKNFGTPVIIARDIPCYVCMKCPPVCPSGALNSSVVEKEQIRMGVAVVNENLCLPFMGVICRSCFESCPIFREAITMKDERYPVVHPEKCIGCGICEQVCPAEEAAITIIPQYQLD